MTQIYLDWTSRNLEKKINVVHHKHLNIKWYIIFDKSSLLALSQINTTSLCSQIPKF